jgi:DNA-binding response OmpR family regulator
MKKILIIEDNENLGKLLEKFFQSKDFTVGLVRDGSVGLAELKMMNPDIALLDMSLPSMNGYEILEARSRDVNLKKVPVVVISNSGQGVEISRIQELGATDHIVKVQMTPDEVYQKVASILNMDMGTSSREVVIEDKDEPTSTCDLANVEVLWIEDDMFLGSIVGRKLAATGAHHQLAKSGEEAFTALAAKKPQVIVLDLVLPGMSGFEILEKLMADPATKDIPVIVLSNLDQRNDMEKCFKLGAKKFFVKALVSLDRIFDEIKNVVKGA